MKKIINKVTRHLTNQPPQKEGLSSGPNFRKEKLKRLTRVIEKLKPKLKLERLKKKKDKETGKDKLLKKREKQILLKNTTNKNKMIKTIKNKTLKNLKLPKLNFIFRPLRTTSVFLLVLITIFGQLVSPQVASAATYDFIQGGWTGGATSNVANHENNQTEWTEYASKNGVDTSSTVSLTPSSPLSSTKTSWTDFNTGTNSQTEISGTGDGASVKIDTTTFTTPMVAQGKYSNGNGYSLKSDGTVWAWGNNSNGQIGDGTTLTTNKPVQVKDSTGTGYLTGVIYIAAGDATAYALKSDGTVWSWGWGGEGRLGNGGTASASLPTQVITSGGVPLGDVRIIASSLGEGGAGNAYALKNDGTVWAWGANASGQLGTGDTNQSSIAVQVSGLSNVSNISAGYIFAYALKNDGTVWSWGKNNAGQLGDGTTTDSNIPIQVHGVGNVGNLEGIISISSSSGGGYALKSDGTVFAWGDNGAGQIGNGTRWGQRYTPVLVSSLSGIISVSSGRDFAYVLKSDGTVWAWGNNNYGQLGDNTTTLVTSPIQVHGIGDSGNLGNIIAISAGFSSVSALSSDGTIVSWGNNNYGQLGDNTTTQRNTPVKVLWFGLGDFNTGQITTPKIAAGWNAGYVIRADGTAWAWGGNGYSRLGDGTGTTRTTPIQVHGELNSGVLTGVTNMADGDNHTVAVKSDGTVWDWGRGMFGNLGNNTTNDSSTPIQVHGAGNSGYLLGVVSVAASGRASYAVKSDGTAWAWGEGDNGELGNGVSSNSSVPVQVSGLSDVKEMTGGSYSGYAVKNNGEVWSWGNNWSGILGDAGGPNTNTPTQVHGPGNVGTLSGITSISSGNEFVLALKNDGTVWSWGTNENGKLGNGTTVASNVPVPVSNLTNVVAISASRSSSYALKSDGTVWAWGLNSSGQLGNNSTTQSTTPIQVLGFGGSGYLGNIVAISGGGDSAYALSADGTIWSWGLNSSSQLGDGSSTQSNTPIRVHGFGNSGYFNVVTSKLAENSESSSQILKSDGTVWNSGYNPWGKFGNGNGDNKTIPVQTVGSGGSGFLTDVVSISGSSYSSHFLKSDGTVWSSGRNGSGEFGDNTTNSSSTPVQVHGSGNVGNLTDIVSISSAAATVYALKNDGTVWAWGNGGNSELGNGTTVNSYTLFRFWVLVALAF